MTVVAHHVVEGRHALRRPGRHRRPLHRAARVARATRRVRSWSTARSPSRRPRSSCGGTPLMDAVGRHVGRRVARGLRAPRGAGRPILGDDFPDDRAGPRRGRAAPRHPDRVLAHLRHRLQRPRRPGVLPQRRPHVRVGRSQRRPGGATRRPSTAPAPTACRAAWDRARSSCSSSRAARRRAAAPTSPPRCRRRRSGSRPGDTFEILLGGEEQSGTWLPLGPGPGLRARARLLLRLGRRPSRRRSSSSDSTPQGTSAPAVSAERVAQMLETAAHEVEHSSVYFRDLQARMRDAQDAEPVRRARRLGPRRAGHHLQPRLRVAAATTRPSWSSSTRTAAALWGISSLHAARGTSRSTTRPASPAATTGRSSPTPTASCGSCSPGVDPGTANWLDTAGPPRGAHHRAVVPAAGAAADPQRDRAARRRSPTTCPTAIRGRRRRARRRDPRPRRARRLEVPHMSDRRLGRRARRHRHRRVEGRGTRHRARTSPGSGASLVITARKPEALEETVGRARRASARPTCRPRSTSPTATARSRSSSAPSPSSDGSTAWSPTRRPSARSRRSPRSPSTTWTCC